MKFKWDEPMNPYAERDFAHAMKEASEDLNKKVKDFSDDLKRIGEQMKANVGEGKLSFIELDEMPEEYSGVMRLAVCTMWEDVIKVLLGNGYEVTARLEDATETEKELDGADKFVVIEYEEVE